MVYGFVKQSGGDVVLDSEEGAGTVVRLLLPRHDGVETEAVHAGNLAAADIGSRKVLVLEDEQSVRYLIKAMLERAGHEVSTAAGIAAAEQLYAETRPDVVLTDIVLANGESGVEFAAALRARDPGLPILLISGYPDPVLDTDDALAARLPLLRKPFGANELARAVADLLIEQ